jgi:hypothetical protein
MGGVRGGLALVSAGFGTLTPNTPFLQVCATK